MREFTVIVPTWNMGRYLPALYRSVVNSPFAQDVEEIIFACEKSTDGSEKIIADLAREQGDKLPRVRMVQPEKRLGHFMTRYAGASAAKTEKLLFIDSRIQLPAITTANMARLSRQYGAMTANVDIDIQKNVFCLYWRRSHETIFRKTYEANAAGAATVTSENFDE